MIPAGPYAFDLTVTHALQASQLTWLNGMAKIITFVSGPELAVAISLVIIIWRFSAPWLVKLAGHGAGAWRRQEQAVWLLLLMLGNALTLIIKHLVERPRPSIDLVHVLVRETSTSFPSGHALGAVITAAALWCFWRPRFISR
ncbi:MAG: phosphatase PAP2 family protein, partial [Patescibacteria group bacterium]